eukprot:1122835-Alexandrium_andersonii.AAC.1
MTLRRPTPWRWTLQPGGAPFPGPRRGLLQQGLPPPLERSRRRPRRVPTEVMLVARSHCRVWARQSSPHSCT